MINKTRSKQLTIGTHNGIFHCDEVIAIAIIKILFENLREIKIIRTRNMEILKSECDLIIDIGGGKFDHHQKNIKEKRENGISYASAGLVWREFGILVIKKISENLLDTCEIEKVFYDIDKKIIQNVDMEDNGEKFNNHPFEFINHFLPQWNDTNQSYDLNFEKALQISTDILKQYISYNIYTRLCNKEIENRIKNPITRIDNILIIPSQTIPWLEKVIEYNNFQNDVIDFVVFPYPAGGFALQCVPVSIEEKFSQRIPLPTEWAGETEKLSKITNIATATFCHKGKFFARADEFSDIIMMCQKATTQSKKLIKK